LLYYLHWLVTYVYQHCYSSRHALSRRFPEQYNATIKGRAHNTWEGILVIKGKTFSWNKLVGTISGTSLSGHAALFYVYCTFTYKLIMIFMCTTHEAMHWVILLLSIIWHYCVSTMNGTLQYFMHTLHYRITPLLLVSIILPPFQNECRFRCLHIY
jgi:hypothetical protein